MRSTVKGFNGTINRSYAVLHDGSVVPGEWDLQSLSVVVEYKTQLGCIEVELPLQASFAEAEEKTG
jgi:hypothetical protein